METKESNLDKYERIVEEIMTILKREKLDLTDTEYIQEMLDESIRSNLKL